MSAALHFLVAHSLHVAVLAVVLWCVLRLLATNMPRVRLVSWQAALAAVVLLPFASVVLHRTPATDAIDQGVPSVVALMLSPGGAMTMPGSSIPSASVLIGIVAAGGLLRATWIGGTLLLLHRRFGRAEGASHPLFQSVRDRLAADARLVWRADVSHPFTFSTAPAVVVMPLRLAGASDDTLRAVFTHELVHVARRDWGWVLTEEAARTALWFHPAVWLIVGELRQAREEVVDRVTVAIVGARRNYVQALISLAEAPPSLAAHAAVPFFTSRQLTRRIAALVSEAPMSKLRLIATSVAVLGACSVTMSAAARAVPLPSPFFSQEQRPSSEADPSEAGALERAAYMAPKDAPPPPRTKFMALKLPAEAREMGHTEVDVRLVLDKSGRVAEARVLMVRAMRMTLQSGAALKDSVLAAVRQWQFEPPALAPLALTTTLLLDAPERASISTFSTSERPVAMDLKNAVYPYDAMHAGIQGEVEVEVTVDATGRVAATRVVRSVTPSIDQAAIDALNASTFRPGMKDGQPVPVTVTIMMKFTLK